MTILYILLFLVCLSTLIMVHEAGHLVTAKIFKVYCFEYALGFGPRLFSFKRKNGETRFSIRAIPFGGFVSMYGEADAVPPEFEGVEINKSRSINNIKHWKRAIIMTAGIMMNFVLAMIVFFIYEIAFPAYTLRYGHIIIAENSIAADAGLKSNDLVYSRLLGYGNDTYVFYDTNGVVNYADSSTKNAYIGYSYGQMTIKDQSVYSRSVAFERRDVGDLSSSATAISYSDALNGDYSGAEENIVHIEGYIQSFALNTATNTLTLRISEHYLDKQDKFLTVYKTYDASKDANLYKLTPFHEIISINGDMETVDSSNKMKIVEYKSHYPNVEDNILKDYNKVPNNVSFNMQVLDEEHIGVMTDHVINSDIVSGGLESRLGISVQLDEYQNSYGEAVGNSFADFGKSTTLIFRGLGQLFTAEGFKNVGGIVAIGVVTTQTLEQNGFGNFLFMWAMISVNLGIVNLLPFPGLDGWQFLVTIVEGVAHKEIPAKVKNTMSAIGLLLLFALMIMIVIKDIIMVV